jgi:hypothetical protein
MGYFYTYKGLFCANCYIITIENVTGVDIYYNKSKSMKDIIISESQLSVLESLVKEDDGIMLDNGSTKEYGDETKIGTSAPIVNSDGDEIPGKDVASDEISKTLSYQGYFGNARTRY